MTGNLEDREWALLCSKIKRHECTPFIGAGLSLPHIPSGAQIAQEWGEENGFPLQDDKYNLARVAQFLAVQYDPSEAKHQMIERWLKNASSPNFSDPNEPYPLLANLNLPLYITTNYDDFIFRSLKLHPKNNPQRVVCPWNTSVQSKVKNLEDIKPSPDNPVIFHIHGCEEIPESMVLTEDDYVDYLIEIAKTYKQTHTSGTGQPSILPTWVTEALTGTSLLFVGYSFSDWNFNMLFRSISYYLQNSIKPAHVSVQLAPGHDRTGWSDSDKVKAMEYLNRYFDRDRINIYWGTAADFFVELKKRLGI